LGPHVGRAYYPDVPSSIRDALLALFFSVFDRLFPLLLQLKFFLGRFDHGHSDLFASLIDVRKELVLSVAIEYQFIAMGNVRIVCGSHNYFFRSFPVRAGDRHHRILPVRCHVKDVFPGRQGRLADGKRVVNIRFKLTYDLRMRGRCNKKNKGQAQGKKAH
jgi:hypothetical protein